MNGGALVFPVLHEIIPVNMNTLRLPVTRLTEEIERRKKIRNDIEQDTSVQIKNKNLEAAKLSLSIQRDEEYARLEQQREIEIRRAEQAAQIAKEQAAKTQDAEQARITANQQVEQTRITSERAVEQENIQKQKAIEISNQERDIAVAKKSEEQSIAKAKADEARAKAVEAEERVVTSREREVAERQKQIELIEAAKEAEREAITIKVAAEAEKMTAAAAEIRYAVDATGRKALNEAANLLSVEQVAMTIKLKLIENLESIIRESVKPMESIDGIKIVQVEGLNAGVAANNNGEAGVIAAGGGNLADQVVNSALRYRAQAPLLDSLMREVGIDGSDINGLTNIGNIIAEPSKPKPAQPPRQKKDGE